MRQVAITESFVWAQQLWPILKQFENDGVNFYKVVATNADIKNRNNRVYTSEELSRAAASLSERPLNINHDQKSQLPFPENEVIAARFEEGRVECIIQVADEQVNKMIESGEINHVSIEGMYLDTSKNTPEAEYPSSLHFQGLALLTKDDPPGDALTMILKESAKNRFAIPGDIMEQLVIPKTNEVEWTAAYQDSLPDSSFAYIESGGKKDADGKTVPRNLRHLPYRDINGKPDPAHVRNALARLPQSDIPADAKAEAQKKLETAGKEVGIEVSKDSFRIALERGIITNAQYYAILNEMGSDAKDDPVVDPGKDHSTDGDSEQKFRGVKTEPQSIGVGNPQATVKPKMDYPQETNPLAITNDSAKSGIIVSAPSASDLKSALTNASTNDSVRLLPQSVSESETPLTKEKSEEKLSQVEQGNVSEQSQTAKESTQPPSSTQAPAPQQMQISVKLEGASELKEAAEKMVSVVKEATSNTPKPQAKVSSTEIAQTVQESREVKEAARFEKIAKFMREMVNAVREDISSSAASGALGQIWSPDMVVLPPDLPANLRRFCQVKFIEKGSKQINFTTITTPAFSALIEDTSPSDVTQTITEISAVPTETGAKQRISYVTMESATPDVVQAVERAFQAAALIDEDAQVLQGCDSGTVTPAATLYGDESVTAESSITSAMTFKAARLASALREIQKKGYSVNPGDIIAVLHPVQYDSLLKDTAISQYLYFGSAGPIQQGVIPQVYGVDVVRSTKVPTGSGSGSPAITTYHAQVFLKAQAKGSPNGIGVGGAIALGISRDLMLEQWRRVDERALYLIASHRIAAVVVQPNALVRIYTS